MSKATLNYLNAGKQQLENIVAINGFVPVAITDTTVELEYVIIQNIPWIPERFRFTADNPIQTALAVSEHGFLLIGPVNTKNDWECGITKGFGDDSVEHPEKMAVEFWGGGTEEEDVMENLPWASFSNILGHYAAIIEGKDEIYRRVAELHNAVRNAVKPIRVGFNFNDDAEYVLGLEADVLFKGKSYHTRTHCLLTAKLEDRVFHLFDGSGGIPWNILMDCDDMDRDFLNAYEKELEDIDELPMRNLEATKIHLVTGEKINVTIPEELLEQYNATEYVGDKWVKNGQVMELEING
ncbi:hypothetical protein [Vibrio phage vB_pir03]|nr:hypothetical protein [Vibrio phage vB_pir03]